MDKKDFKERGKEIIAFFKVILWITIISLIVGISVSLPYFIATSELPDWIKFILLK